jgi:alpha-L-arabinofuranosidase
MVLPDLKKATNQVAYAAVDALAALAKDGSLLLSIVNRGSTGPVQLAIVVEGFHPAASAELQTLSATRPWEGNSMESPEVVKPVDRALAIEGEKIRFELGPYTVARLRLAPKG